MRVFPNLFKKRSDIRNAIKVAYIERGQYGFGNFYKAEKAPPGESAFS